MPLELAQTGRTFYAAFPIVAYSMRGTRTKSDLWSAGSRWITTRAAALPSGSVPASPGFAAHRHDGNPGLPPVYNEIVERKEWAKAHFFIASEHV